jgi:integrase
VHEGNGVCRRPYWGLSQRLRGDQKFFVQCNRVEGRASSSREARIARDVRSPKAPIEYGMIHRRAKSAGSITHVGNHSFRATGVIACLKNGGTARTRRVNGNHASVRTTQLYDRRTEEATLDEVELILG